VILFYIVSFITLTSDKINTSLGISATCSAKFTNMGPVDKMCWGPCQYDVIENKIKLSK